MNTIAAIRGSGTTTWILKAAIKSPRCIIVSKDEYTSEKLNIMYRCLILKEGLLKRLYWEVVGREYPIFISLDSSLEGFRGLNRPIIFDNSAYYKQ